MNQGLTTQARRLYAAQLTLPTRIKIQLRTLRGNKQNRTSRPAKGVDFWLQSEKQTFKFKTTFHAMQAKEIEVQVGKAVCSSEGSFKNKDGQTIFTRQWKSEHDPPKALIFVTHGFGEHSGRYSDFLAPGLVEEGFAVFTHDHVGHGKSDGERAQIHTFDTYVRDVLDHIDQVTPKYPATPFFLFGHSMGGVIAILTAMQRPKFFTGVVLSAPPLILDPQKATKCMRFMGKIVGWVMPGYQISPAIDPSTTSRDPENVKEYANDPLVWHGGIKTGWGLALVHAIDKLQEEMDDIEWPFLIMQGTADVLSMPQGSVEFEKRAKSKDKTIKIYEGYYHDLFHEPIEDATLVLNDTRQWLRERMPSD